MLRLPEQKNQRVQALMQRNNEGQLSDGEPRDLAALAELSERLSLERAEALHPLSRKPCKCCDVFVNSAPMDFSCRWTL